MHLNRPFPALLALTSFACVIDPGVLEGGADSDTGETETGELDSTDDADSSDTESDSTDTGAPELAECLQGTNPQGGADPGEFAVDTCPAFACDEGWGHDAAQLPIAWTLEFAKPVAESDYTPVGVVPRSQAPGVLIVARRDTGPELSTVSAQGQLLDSTMLPTSLWISRIEAGEGVIYMAAFDEQESSSSVLAIDESGELLWSVPVEGAIQSLAALPDGGVVVALIYQGGGDLLALSSGGAVQWTEPTLTPVGLGVSPSGRILVTGHQPLEFSEHFMNLHDPDGALLGQAPAPGTLGELWDLHFVDEQHVLGSGGRSVPSSDGVVQLVDLEVAASVWVHAYNRALDNCYQGVDLPTGESTWDWFGETARLPDGSFLIATVEEGLTSDSVQPRVIHFDENGEFLASDRGLWAGQARTVAASNDGSAYALLSIGGYQNYDGPNDGFYLRKYQP
jgi:hypothetical protein